jgi:hypothetical protein
MSASNYLENRVLDHVLKNTSFTQPANLYLALFKNTSGNAATNLEGGILTDEITGGAYARKLITFAAAASGTAASNLTVTFNTATATWGTITHVAIVDALTSGNVLFYGPVTTPKTIETGDTFQASSGNISISLN